MSLGIRVSLPALLPAAAELAALLTPLPIASGLEVPLVSIALSLFNQALYLFRLWILPADALYGLSVVLGFLKGSELGD